MSSTISLVIGAVGLLAAVFGWCCAAPVPGPDPGRDRAGAAGLGSPPTRSAASRTSREADQVRSRAETDAATIMREAGQAADKAAQASRDADEELRAVRDEARELRADLERREARLAEREARLDAEIGKLDERSAGLDRLLQELDGRRADLDRLDEERRAVLEQTAGLTADQAKAELVAGIQNQAKREAALLVRETENAARRDGEQRARRIVTLAIQRVASEQTSESVVSVLHLPGDEMKGRIIGREGRNIRAFESVTGVNLIIDDTPEAVLLSCFDPVRREVGGSPWSGWCWTGGSTRSGSRRRTSGARARSSSCASGPGRTRWSTVASPTCTRNWSPCSAGCATARRTARTCCSTWSSPRTSPA